MPLKWHHRYHLVYGNKYNVKSKHTNSRTSRTKDLKMVHATSLLYAQTSFRKDGAQTNIHGLVATAQTR